MSEIVGCVWPGYLVSVLHNHRADSAEEPIAYNQQQDQVQK